MKHKRILQYFSVLLFAVIVFFIGFYCGIDNYKAKLIAAKYIDGKYGKAFYGVEVFGKDVGSRSSLKRRQPLLPCRSTV